MATSSKAILHSYTRMSDVVKEPKSMLMPIHGYEKTPLVSLEEAVVPLVSLLPRIQTYVHVAKARCDPEPADGLTLDQSASIMLYTMEWEPQEQCLYIVLNATLRAEDRKSLKPWFSYLKLIFSGLSKLPNTPCTVYRGVSKNLSSDYIKGKTFIWWGFSSCASSIEVLENDQFLGKKGTRTLFTIDCNSGKDISRHSYYRSEVEILLLPARNFQIISCLEAGSGLQVVQLKEIESSIVLLEPVDFEKKPTSASETYPNEKANDKKNLKSIINQISNLLELDSSGKKDDILKDLLENGQQSLNKYERYLIPDIYTDAMDGHNNELIKHLKNYFEQQWKIEHNDSKQWFIQFLNQCKYNDNSHLYEQVLIRTAKYGNKFMKTCSILSIILQILFEGIDDKCLEKTNIFDELWFTITTDGLNSIKKYSKYIIEDVMNEQINDKQSILAQALREYYHQELFQLLKQCNIIDRQNLYEFALNNVAQSGWKVGLQAIQKKIAPINYENLSHQVDSYLKQQQDAMAKLSNFYLILFENEISDSTVLNNPVDKTIAIIRQSSSPLRINAYLYL